MNGIPKKTDSLSGNMPRDTYQNGEILTDDLGRLWWITAQDDRRGLLMPELPTFLANADNEEVQLVQLPGWEFHLAPPDYVLAEREACARVADERSRDILHASDADAAYIINIQNEVAEQIAYGIRNRK